MGAREVVHELLGAQGLAVLATTGGQGAYASLVAVADSGPGRLYFATTRASHKASNMVSSDGVSLLLDNRSNAPSDFHEAAAATAVGTASECDGEESVAATESLLRRHPYLDDFLASPSTSVFVVDVDRWYVATRFRAVECFEPKKSS